jgi:hypothetical protein
VTDRPDDDATADAMDDLRSRIEGLESGASQAAKLLSGLRTEAEFLRMRVTVLEQALAAAGIPVPPTRQELAEAARRGE